jgi:glutamyl-tRNA synthetase
VKARARKLADIVPLVRPFWAGDRPRRGRGRQTSGDSEAIALLAAWREALAGVDPFNAATLESALRSLAESHGSKPGPLIHATRVAVTGWPCRGLFDVLELMGRERVMARLEEVRQAPVE